MKVGIVGLPNAGKSSLFNALTRAGAPVAGYAFTTVEPNVAVVPVADERLEKVAEVVGAKPLVPESIEFRDIAGLVRGAHKGEGLGNQFLSTSARPMHSSTSCARTRTPRSRTPRAGSIPWRTRRRWRPSCSWPISSRPSGDSSESRARLARVPRRRWPRALAA